MGARGWITEIDTSPFPPGIIAYTSLEDGGGSPITHLGKQDFQVIADGARVSYAVANFEQLPEVRVVLAIDRSGSMEGEPLDRAKDGIENFLNKLSDPDWVEVIAFNQDVHRLQEWTTDKGVALTVVSSLEADGDTAIYDALWIAADDLLGIEWSGPEAIVLLSDGADTSSEHTLEQALRRLEGLGVPVFTIGLRTEKFDEAALRTIAEDTGGYYLEASSPSELEALYSQIAGSIRAQYRFVLFPTHPSDSGKHRLSITAGAGNAVRMERDYQGR